MTNRNKAKGDTEERAVLAILRAAGFPHAERTRAGRAEDQGDIFLDNAVGLAPSVIAQVKNVATPNWTAWLGELDDQKRRSKAVHAFLTWKRSRPGGKPPHRLAIMPLADYAQLLREAGYGDPLEIDSAPTQTEVK